MEKLNNHKIINNHWIEFIIYSDKRLWTIWTDIFFTLQGKNKDFDYQKDITIIDNNLLLYDLWLWEYILESEDRDYLHSQKNNLESNWTEVFWEFEYNWKYYLILHRAKKDWEIKIAEESGQNANNVKDILDN